MIESKIATHLLHARADNEQLIAALLHAGRFIANRPRESGIAFFPVKDLSGIERFREID